MSLQKNISKYWDYLEQKYPSPKYIGQVKSMEFKDLKKAIETKNEIYLKKLIRNMYVKKEAYILRKAATKKFKETVLDLANHYKKTRKTSFYKMLDGAPNFHRAIDKNMAKKYSVFAIKHSFYFLNWNVKNELEKKFKDGVYKHWRYIKCLAGNGKKQFENNIPSDKQIDRLQIVRYPAGGGELKDHFDSRHNQRIVSGIIMSKIGEDFNEGGFYFKSSKTKKKNIEEQLELGDAVIFYGSIGHGVEKVDPQEKLSWKSNAGRWYVGMMVNDSDHVHNRLTSKDLSESVEKQY
jgi:hypothetical protein